MLFQIIQNAIAFLTANPALAAMVWAIVEWVKLQVQPHKWCKDWYITAFAFVVSFFFAIPEAGFPAVGADPVSYIANGALLGLATTGIYKMGTTLVRKVTKHMK